MSEHLRIADLTGLTPGEMLRMRTKGSAAKIAPGSSWQTLSENYTLIAESIHPDKTPEVQVLPKASELSKLSRNPDLVILDGSVLGVPPEKFDSANASHRQGLIELHGLFLHEMAHLMFSKWTNEKLDAREKTIANILEELRVDLKFSLMRPQGAPWLKAASARKVKAALASISARKMEPSLMSLIITLETFGRVLTGSWNKKDISGVVPHLEAALSSEQVERIRSALSELKVIGDHDGERISKLAKTLLGEEEKLSLEDSLREASDKLEKGSSEAKEVAKEIKETLGERTKSSKESPKDSKDIASEIEKALKELAEETLKPQEQKEPAGGNEGDSSSSPAKSPSDDSVEENLTEETSENPTGSFEDDGINSQNGLDGEHGETSRNGEIEPNAADSENESSPDGNGDGDSNNAGESGSSGAPSGSQDLSELSIKALNALKEMSSGSSGEIQEGDTSGEETPQGTQSAARKQTAGGKTPGSPKPSEGEVQVADGESLTREMITATLSVSEIEAMRKSMEEVAANAVSEVQRHPDSTGEMGAPGNVEELASKLEDAFKRSKPEKALTKKKATRFEVREFDADESLEGLEGIHGFGYGASRTYGVRKPSSKERIIRTQLSAHLRRTRFRSRTSTDTSSLLPPGRLRSRELVKGAAERSRGKMVSAKPWKARHYRSVEEPKLRVGVLCDVSGSMSSVVGAVASSMWATASAVVDNGGTSVGIAFGDHAQVAIDVSYKAPEEVVYFPGDGGMEAIYDALKIADERLDLYNKLTHGNSPRILVIVSDGHWVDSAQNHSANKELKKLLSSGVKIIHVGLGSKPHPHPGSMSVVIKTPSEIAKVIGDACLKAAAEN